MSNNTTFSPLIQNVMLYFSVLGSLGSLSVILNGFVLFAIWRNKTHEFRNGTSFIIGNLALADALTGVAVLLYISAGQCIAIAHFQVSMIWTTVLASLSSLILLSIERSIGFAYSFKVAIVTVPRTLAALLCIWILSVCCGIFVHFYRDASQFALTIIYEAAVVIFSISHMLIYKRMQRINKQLLSVGRKTSTNSQCTTKRKWKNNHVNGVVLILIFVLVVTMLPYLVAVQLIFWYRLQLKPTIDITTLRSVLKFANYYYPIEILNFVVNPIVYCWRLRRYRRAFVEAVNCCGVNLKIPRKSSSSQNNNTDSSTRKQKETMHTLINPVGSTSV